MDNDNLRHLFTVNNDNLQHLLTVNNDSVCVGVLLLLFFPSSYTVWFQGKYKVCVMALDVAARVSQFSSNAQMYFISSAQRHLGRPRGIFEFDLVV